MKRIFTFAMAAASVISGFASSQTIGTANEWNAAFTGTYDTIFVNYVDGGINLKNQNIPANGSIHIIGINNPENGELACIKFEMKLPTNTEADRVSLHFENIAIEDYNGAGGNSKHLFDGKGSVYYLDSLTFKGCDIRNFNRSIYRVEPGKDADGNFISAGTLNYIGIENSKIHNGSALKNSMPMFNIGQMFTEIVVNNCVFYDLPWLNCIFAINYLNEDTGKDNVAFTFTNNTVIAYPQSNPLFNFGNFVGEMSQITFENNIIARPYWELSSPYEAGARTASDTLLSKFISLSYGFVHAHNNVIEGYRYWASGVKLDEDGEGAWLESDTLGNYTFADAEFEWSDFADAETNDYSVWNGEKIYTLGVDGAPIGAKWLYTDTKKQKVAFSATANGGFGTSVVITPAAEQYFSGDVVTITAIDRNSLYRNFNTFLGWSDGNTDKTRVITLTEDLALTANFEAQVNVLAAFDFAGVSSNIKTADSLLWSDFQASEATKACVAMFNADTTGLAAGETPSYEYKQGYNGSFQARAGKFGEDEADKQMNIISRRTAAPVKDTHPSYALFKFNNDKTAAGLAFSCFVGTDNNGHALQKAEYSLDGATWTQFATVELESAGLWYELKGNLPAEVEGKDVFYVRVISDATKGHVLNEDGCTEEAYPTTDCFEYLGNVLVTFQTSTGIEKVAVAEKAAVISDDAPVFNILGQRVENPVSGQLYFKAGKKYFVK